MTAPYSRTPTTAEFLVAEYEGRRALISRIPDYQETIECVKRTFPKLKTAAESRNREIIIRGRLEDIGDGIRITPHSWSTVLPSLNFVQATIDTSSWVEILVEAFAGRTITLGVNPTIDTVDTVKDMICFQDGCPPNSQQIRFNFQKLEKGRTLSDYGICAGARLSYSMLLAKPIIYLFPPKPLTNIRVQLSLVQTLVFSDIYPHTTITTLTDHSKNLGQGITWTVDAKPDGTLLDQASEREVSYLFWEACTVGKAPSSPPTTRPSSPNEALTDAFDPTNPILLPSQSALLPFVKVTGYIDDVLLALGLHTEARTSFITYWLPNLSKHAYIALRFLPQDEYEKAAPLSVTPAPDVMTRVFMLFMGVEESQLGLWDDAVAMASKDATVWRDIVGVDFAKMHDKTLFRALEWGGMEVK